MLLVVFIRFIIIAAITVMEHLLSVRLTQKSFAISIPAVFFFLYFSSLFLDGLPKGFLEEVLSLVIKKVCDLYLTHSLDTSRHVFVKINPEVVIYDKCDT